MLDDNTLRRRVLLRLLGSPLTVVPFVVGMSALAATWALDWKPGIGAFAAVVGTMASVGVFFTRLLLGGESAARRVLTESERDRDAVRQRALDALDKQLTSADKDPRPEAALRDLRALAAALQEAIGDSNGENGSLIIDINLRVGQLFDQCVASLRETDRLWQTARRLNSPAARQPLLDQRERIITDVQATTRQLSQTLVALQSLGSTRGAPADLSRLRDELDQSLEVARTVEERVNDLVREAAGPVLAQPPVLPQTQTRN